MENIQLHQVTCAVSDFPDNHTICVTTSAGHVNSSVNGSTIGHQVCFNCYFISLYLFGEKQGTDSLGFLVTKYIVALTVLFGLFGAITNILNILILRKSPCGPSLTVLLIPLSICDFVTSVSAAIFAGAGITLLGGYDKRLIVQQLLYYSLNLFYISRTSSIFICVVITVERYYVIVKPLQAKIWFSVVRTKQLCCVAFLLAVVVNAPRWFEKRWREVEPSMEIADFTKGYSYILEYTEFGHSFYQLFCEVYFTLDFILPLPLFLVFNYLIYKGIEASNKTRRRISSAGVSVKHRNSEQSSSSATQSAHPNEVNAAKMFRIVVLCLLICHIVPIIFHIIVGFWRFAYRELGITTVMSITLNSAINLFIYCAFGKAFRASLVALLKQIMCISRRDCTIHPSNTRYD